MKVVHYGNACFSIMHNGTHILCDPWIEGPAVAGGWSKFPPSQTRMEDIKNIDYVYISHIHSDHCEEKTLEKLPRDIPIIIMDLKPGFLEKMLRGRGFTNLIVVPEKTSHTVAPGLKVEVFPASFGHICANVIDSSILFDFGDRVVLNCNDNKPSEDLCRYIVDKYRHIDLAFVPAGGGSGYPAMYENLSPEEKAMHVKKTVENYADGFTKAVDILKPTVAVPVAGGFAIRGPLAETVNWFQARRFNQLEVVELYEKHGTSKATKLRPIQPEMELDGDTGEYTKGQYHVWTDAELKAHFAKLAKEVPESKIKTTAPMRGMDELLKAARAGLWSKQEKMKMFPEYTIYLDIEGRQDLFEIQLHKPETRKIGREEPRQEPYLKMRLDQDSMLEWVLGFEDFNMLDSGHRISFFRHPNTYVVDAYYLMSLLRLG